MSNAILGFEDVDLKLVIRHCDAEQVFGFARLSEPSDPRIEIVWLKEKPKGINVYLGDRKYAYEFQEWCFVAPKTCGYLLIKIWIAGPHYRERERVDTYWIRSIDVQCRGEVFDGRSSPGIRSLA